MSLLAGASLLATGVGLGQNYLADRNRDRARRSRRNYFDNNLKPLLDGMEPDQDIDFGAIRSAEMQMPTQRFQDQMIGMSNQRNTAMTGSGFSSSGFIDNDFQRGQQGISAQFANDRYNVDRGILDMQSQIESMVAENRLRAKELEFSYKYG